MARVTVLFSTLNGAHTLPRMLDSLERLKPPAGGWKVVAVDNGSIDNSRCILEQRAAKLPMTVVSEPRRGKNVALNAGLVLTEGDIVALTDDDVILPEDWLVAVESVAARNTDYDIFGGAIYPIWEETPPDWVLRCVPIKCFSCTDYPEGPIDPHLVWGAEYGSAHGCFPRAQVRRGHRTQWLDILCDGLGNRVHYACSNERAPVLALPRFTRWPHCSASPAQARMAPAARLQFGPRRSPEIRHQG